MVLRQLQLENSNLPTWQIFSPVNPWGKFWNLPFIVYWQRGWMTVFATVLTKKTCVENSQQLVATLRYCWGRIRASLLMCKNHIKGCQRVYYIHTDICCVYLETYISIYIYSTYVYNIYNILYEIHIDWWEFLSSTVYPSDATKDRSTSATPSWGDASTQCSPQHGCLCSSTRLLVKEGWSPRMRCFGVILTHWLWIWLAGCTYFRLYLQFPNTKHQRKITISCSVWLSVFDTNLSCFANSGGYGSYDAGRLAVSCLESLVDVGCHLVLACLVGLSHGAVKMKFLEQFRGGLLMFLTYAQPPNWLTT